MSGTAVATRRSKKALPFKRRSSFLAYPEDLHLEKTSGKKHYDPRVHSVFVERDVAWILTHGVQKAVLVEKCGDQCVVVDGRQRVINSREANCRLVAEGGERIMIPVAPKRGSAIKLFQISVICNTHRRDDCPVTEAFKMQQYLDMGHNENDCAELWGVSKYTIRNRLNLLSLCDEAQSAITAGTITVTRALGLINLSAKDQKAALKKKPTRKRSRRPSKKKIEKVLAFEGVALPAPVRVAIEWVTGVITDKEAAEKIKSLGSALAATAPGVVDPDQGTLFSE